MRAVIYARYSTDLQSAASIEDQVEVCRRFAASQGWKVTATYDDRAMSGASAFRPGLQQMLADLDRKTFDVVVVEALDRIGRKLADIAAIHDRLQFAGVRLFAASTGEVTAVHIGLLGTMAQLALSDLRDKTRRGLLGRARAGKVPGGRAYGYDVVEPDGGGRKGNRGERRINEAEAMIVRRIFQAFAGGQSPRAIAKQLNAERVPAPDGRFWNDTTIRGQQDRGTGLLNNPLYVGRLEWNRTSYVKDPRTGKRLARVNPVERREKVELPHLRIVDDAVWHAAKEHQKALRHMADRSGASNRLNLTHRRKFLLSGLLTCAACGGSYSVVARDYYGCRRHRVSGTCDNTKMIRRTTLEERVLNGIKAQLLTPAMVKEFIAEFRAEWNRIARDEEQAVRTRSQELVATEKKIAGVVRAIEDGAWTPTLKQRLADLEARRAELAVNAGEPASRPSLRLHPKLADVYREKVEQLQEALNEPGIRDEAMQILRSMVERIVLRPDVASPDGMTIEVEGDLAAILGATSRRSGRKSKGPDGLPSGPVALSVVAGPGFEPGTFRL